jgi:hypothetical protein
MSASVWEMEHFTQFLRGRHFALFINHKTLINLGTVNTKALSQFQDAMQKYDFEIICLKRSEMAADFQRRNDISQTRINSLKFENQHFELKKDPWIKKIKGLDDDGIRLQL